MEGSGGQLDEDMGVWEQQISLQENILHLDLIGTQASLVIGKELGKHKEVS